MKKISLLVLFLLLIVSTAAAQNTLTAHKSAGERNLGQCRYGAVIWDNFAAPPGGWFCSMTAGYVWLDWGILNDQGNLMPDEVIDGFSFGYATDARIGGISWNMYFFDSCTGWGDYSLVPEAGFAFTGLPDATNLPPGYYWRWTITTDLTGTGYEFLMGEEIGVGHSRITRNITCGPLMTLPPKIGGNGPTDTEDAFDIGSLTGGYMGTYWFGGYPSNPYGSFRSRLMGASDPSTGCSYAGIPLPGNDTALYCVGDWAYGSYNLFLLRLNGMDAAAGAIHSISTYPIYRPAIGKTTVPTITTAIKVPFSLSYTGDYMIYTKICGPWAEPVSWCIQGAITDWLVGGPVQPIDLSMNCIVTP